MAFDDDSGVVFPTRDGAQSGTSNENRMLLKVGGAYGIRKAYRVNVDGSVTRLSTRGGMPEFVTEHQRVAAATSYMTSGAYDVGSFFIKRPALTKDFVVRKNSDVASLEKTNFASFFKPPIVADGEVSQLYTASKMGSDNLTRAAGVLKGTPASNFTGLMRRFMQGRYGCGAYAEVSETFAIGHDYTNTTGIIRFGTTYWLVSLKTSDCVLSVFARKISFPSKYQRLLNTSASGKNFDAIEILCFGHATVSEAEYAVGAWQVPEGDPLAYGWKFSLTTNTADVVIRVPTHSTLDIHMWTHMSLSFSASTGVPTCAVRTVERVDGQMLAARSPIWVPGGTTVMANWRSSSPDPDASQSCPLYCFYEGDTLRVVRWAFSKTWRAYDGDEWNDILTTAKCANNIYPVGTASASARYDWGGLYTFGMTCGELSNIGSAGENSVSYEGTVHGYWIEGAYGVEPDMTPPVTPVPPIPRSTSTADWFFPGGKWINVNPYNYPGGAAPASPIYPGEHYSYHRLYYVEARFLSVWKEIRDSSFTTPMVIPANDACAVYLGRKESHTSVDTTRVAYMSGPGRCVEWDMDYSSGPPLYTAFGLWGAPVSVQINNYENNGVLSGVTKPDSGSSSVQLSPILYKLLLRINNATVDVAGAASPIYNPSTNDKALPMLVQAISPSLFQGYKCHSGTLCDGDAIVSGGGYPATIDTFVGVA